MEYAGVARRCVAVLIDFVGFALVVALSGGFYSTTENGVHRAGIDAGWWPFVIFLGYYVVFEAMFGSTIGKLVMGLRLVGEDVDSISWGQALGRNLLRVVDGIFFYFVASIFVWSSPERQ